MCDFLHHLSEHYIYTYTFSIYIVIRITSNPRLLYTQEEFEWISLCAYMMKEVAWTYRLPCLFDVYNISKFLQFKLYSFIQPTNQPTTRTHSFNPNQIETYKNHKFVWTKKEKFFSPFISLSNALFGNPFLTHVLST